MNYLPVSQFLYGMVSIDTSALTLGALKRSGYVSKPIKRELRDNLITALKGKRTVFEGIQGYDDTVIPQLETSILAQHNILFLGLRGQAKTRLARLMVHLLDEYIPVIEGSELNDDPLNPISRFAKELIKEKGDDTPITWLHRDERFAEKLATPDVSVADLIGDVDPIKAATLKLPYSDERVIHYGLIPRAHRGIFVINELPDLQARIQVSLFNILQEGDIQIRGFKTRLPLDIQFVFTANPEDYTNRGSIVTPLKDRIESQIMTHYPRTIEVSRRITDQESRIMPEQKNIVIPDFISNLVETIAVEARESDLVDKKSGVSARLTIAAIECLYSAVERRMLMGYSKDPYCRVLDVYGALPAITGKVELVYEGELEGMGNVAQNFIGKAVRRLFTTLFASPENKKRAKGQKQEKNEYAPIINWFNEGNYIELNDSTSDAIYASALKQVTGLEDFVKKHYPQANKKEQLVLMEFVLHGLSVFSQISFVKTEGQIQFKDIMGSMMNLSMEDSEDEGYYEDEA